MLYFIYRYGVPSKQSQGQTDWNLSVQETNYAGTFTGSIIASGGHSQWTY